MRRIISTKHTGKEFKKNLVLRIVQMVQYNTDQSLHITLYSSLYVSGVIENLKTSLYRLIFLKHKIAQCKRLLLNTLSI